MDDRIRSLAGLALMLSPPALSTAYVLLASRGLPPEADYAALVVTLAAGAGGVLILPRRRRVRLLFLAAYVPVAAFVSVVWSLALTCGAFGGCP